MDLDSSARYILGCSLMLVGLIISWTFFFLFVSIPLMVIGALLVFFSNVPFPLKVVSIAISSLLCFPGILALIFVFEDIELLVDWLEGWRH